MKFIVSILLLFIAQFSFAQQTIWATQLDGYGQTYVWSVASDGLGDMYCAGSIQGPSASIVGPFTTVPLTIPNTTNGFVGRFTPNGQPMWFNTFGDPSYPNEQTTAFSVITDAPHECLYVVGRYHGQPDFDPNPLNFAPPVGASGSHDAFIAKYKLSVGIGDNVSPDDEMIRDVRVDNNGDIYVVGHFSGTVDFDPSASSYMLTSVGAGVTGDAFVAKYDPNGQMIWVSQIESSLSTSSTSTYKMDIDPIAEEIYVIISGFGGYDVDPGPGVVTETASTTLLKLKMSNGLYLAHYPTDPFSQMQAVDYDPVSNLVFATGISTTTNSSCYCFDTNLGIIYQTDIVGTVVFSNGISCDSYSTFWIVGGFMDTVDMDPTAGIFNLNATDFSAFVGRYLKHDGTLLCAFEYDGTGYDFLRDAVVPRGTSNVLVGGVFQETVDFDPFPVYYPLTATGIDGVLAYYRRCSNVAPAMQEDDHDNRSFQVARPKIERRIDMLGQSVNSNYNGIVINIMSDGTRKKVFVMPNE